MNVLCRIAHIADVHVRGSTRHEEYRIVLQNFIDQAREKCVDHIVIAGDLWHTKTQGMTPESVDFMTWWFKEMSFIANVHIILGNHDMNCVNLSRQDAISPIVTAINSDRIFLYKASGVYQLQAGINLCVYSLYDQDEWDIVEPRRGEYNIACYHGPVWGAKTELDWSINDGVTVDFFKDKGYDLCLLGDIHKMQFLDFKDIEIIVNECDLALYPGAEIIEEFDEEV